MTRLRRGLKLLLRLALVFAVLYGFAGFLTSRVVPGPGVVLHPGAPPAPGQEEGMAIWSLVPSDAGDWEAARGVELRGALSVHSGRSGDSEGTLDEIGAAAQRAGLDFVVLGDHPGDWLQEPDAFEPVRRSGALLVPGQEMVIQGSGRVLVVGLDADTVTRGWEGSVADLSARVRAVDGFLSVVHARSPRGRERWQAGLAAPGIHAWESLDVSEMARLRLADRWAGYHLVSFLTGLVTGRAEGPVLRLNREGTRAPGLLAYDSARAGEPLVLTAGLNHHPKARIAGRLVPPYTPFFRTLTNHVRVARPLPDDPRAARATVLEGLRSGRVFVSLGDAARAAGFAFGPLPPETTERTGSGGSAGPILGVRLPDGGPAELLVRLLRNGREVGWIPARAGQLLAIRPPGDGVYRVEVARAGIPLGRWRYGLRPWILSNAVGVTSPSGDLATGSP